MSYEVLLAEEAREYVAALDEKSKRIVKDNLRKLTDDPYPRPDTGTGDKEKLVIDGEELYRLHIGRTHTAFYDVLEADKEVRVIEIVDIDEAHKRYGFE
jgi:mRNA-degrading endonuclease RelE of RelBE toxin-antitoxin system